MAASVIIDIALCVVSAFFIIRHTIKGFFASILDGAKGFVAAILAYLLRIPVAKIFDAWFMRDAIVNWVNNSLVASVEGNDTVVNFVSLYRNVPWLFNSILSIFGLEDASGLEALSSGDTAQIYNVAYDVGSSISYALSTALAIVVLFILIYLSLMLVVKLLDGVVQASSLRVINRVLGFLFGVAISFVVIWIVSFVLEFLSDITNGFGGNLTREDLNKSMIMGIVNAIL